MKKLLLSALFSAALLGAEAQINTPSPSPMGKLSQEVGLTEINVEYSRPSANGREIFGDLVPFGEMWRTGANASTKIEFSEDVKLNGSEVKAGKYALYTIPGKNAWEIIIHKNLEHWGVDGYNEEEDAVRFTASPEKSPHFIETMEFSINNITPNEAVLELSWENTDVKILVETNTAEMVAAQIEAFENPKPNYRPYYNVASYYYQSNKNLDKALSAIDKAVAIQSEAFWVMHLKAKIEMKLGKKDAAIASAKKSKALAESAGNTDYVALNNKLIAKANS